MIVAEKNLEVSEIPINKKRNVITVANVTKCYANKIVLDNISFSLKEGEILGILGSNGAGKTTLLETIEGLRKMESGNINVLGHDIRTSSSKVQNKIGIQLQQTSLFDRLSVRENLKLYSSLYGQSLNIDTLLKEVGLSEQSKTLTKNLSGGQFQKLKLCLSILNTPEILFLDEPTTGLDPSARKNIWDSILELKKRGSSIILTTHYMEEASALCDRIIILHNGKFVADNTPKNLIEMLGYPRTIVLKIQSKIESEWFSDFPCKIHDDEIYISSNKCETDLGLILEIAKKNGITFKNIRIHEANLEDVFMELTNQRLFTHNNPK